MWKGGKKSIPSLSFTAAIPLFAKRSPSCQSSSRGVGPSASSRRDVVVVVDDDEGDDGGSKAKVYSSSQNLDFIIASPF